MQDELLWAAAWLERATDGKTYAQYLNQAASSGGTRSMFSWDDKYVGSQVLVAKVSRIRFSLIRLLSRRNALRFPQHEACCIIILSIIIWYAMKTRIKRA